MVGFMSYPALKSPLIASIGWPIVFQIKWSGWKMKEGLFWGFDPEISTVWCDVIFMLFPDPCSYEISRNFVDKRG